MSAPGCAWSRRCRASASPRQFSILVSSAIRDYLEERFDFRAPERTTEEFLYELQGSQLLTLDQKKSLEDFLASCDLIKFAKYEPTEMELRGLHQSAVRLVNETEPRVAPDRRSFRPGSGPSPRAASAGRHPANDAAMTFAHPEILLALLLLPLLAWLRGRWGRQASFRYSSVELVRPVASLNRSHAGRILAALRWLSIALFLVALAQPRRVHGETQVKASGVDIVVAMDLSGSMASEDFVEHGHRVNRINMAREVLAKFIEGRPSDRLGLVVFATRAFVAAPLTLDHDFLQTTLDRLSLGVIDPNATAIGSALMTAMNQVRDLQSKSKIIILMTDGENNSGKVSPLTAAEVAQTLRVKVYTIGIGVRGTAPMPVGKNPFTGETEYRNLPADVDEETLQKIADMTGGKYYRADSADTMRKIYARN